MTDRVIIKDKDYLLPVGASLGVAIKERSKTHKTLAGSSVRDVSGITTTYTFKWDLLPKGQLEQLLNICSKQQDSGQHATLVSSDGSRAQVLLQLSGYSYLWRGQKSYVKGITLKCEE